MAAAPQGYAPPGYQQQPVMPLAPIVPYVEQPQPTALVTQSTVGAFDVPQAFVERMQLCEFLAAADLLPPALREKPSNVMLIMHKALALDIPLSMAIEHLHVINGKVGHSAELLRGLLHRHGHVLHWPTKSDTQVVGELTLRHDPKRPRTEKFTLQDAHRMKLTNKENWVKDPESMLIARCTTRLVSRHCPEVALALGNLSAIDFGPEDAEPVQATAEVDRDAQPNEREATARELYAEALEINSPEQLTAIGRRAQEDGLLDIKVTDDRTLQEALLKRIQDVRATLAEKSGKAAKDGAK